MKLRDVAMQREDGTELADLDEPQLCRLTLVHAEQNPKPAPASNGNISTTSNSTMDDGEAVCVVCGYHITDRYILKVMDENYHEGCLRCAACHQSLASNATCYTKYGHVYCQQDHSIIFGKRCRRCRCPLDASDIVYRCVYSTFHSHCFTCFYCNAPFNKGDQYNTLDGEIFCCSDFHHALQMRNGDHAAGLYDEAMHEGSRKTPKRPRTILNAQQRRQFKSAFEKSAKPCRKVREQLAKETGLSVRVVQVWFQNQRAKMKKMVRKEEESETYKAGTNSEERSTEEVRSSDDEDMDSDECELEKTTTLTNLSNPIQKLYHMTSSQIYFPYST